MSTNEPVTDDKSGSPGQNYLSLPRRYGALRLIKWVCRGLGCITIVGILVGMMALYHLSQQGTNTLWAGMSTIALTVYGVLIAITLFAASESIAVAIDIEQNTRLTGLLLEKMMERMEK